MTHIESAKWLIEVRLAQSLDDMLMVWAVRGAVFLAESEHSDCATFADEFQANDFGATHFIATVNGDPAGIIRARFFAEFAMLERIGVRERYRSYRLFKALAKYSAEFCRKKGYRIVVGRAFGDTDKLWIRMLNARPSGPPIEFERGELTPMLFRLNPTDQSIRDLPFGHPLVEELIVQREDHWDFNLLDKARTSAA
jgi:GNAT superfamily N-acetyltransferase